MRKRRMLPGGTGPNRKEIRGRLKFVHSRTMRLAHSCISLLLLPTSNVWLIFIMTVILPFSIALTLSSTCKLTIQQLLWQRPFQLSSRLASPCCHWQGFCVNAAFAGYVHTHHAFLSLQYLLRWQGNNIFPHTNREQVLRIVVKPKWTH